MPLSPQIRDRLIELAYDAQIPFFEMMAENEGDDFARGFLAELEKSVEAHRVGLPKLQAYAAECRRKSPLPNPEEFSPLERGQHDVLRAKMIEYRDSEDRRAVLFDPHKAAILSTDRVGLPAAEQVFSGTGALILETAECDDLCKELFAEHDDASFWWFAFGRWTIEEGASWHTGLDAESLRRNFPIPEGSTYWTVNSGVTWGGLAGGTNHELWKWDGQRAEYLETVAISQS